jgi:hypothetical protein
MPARKEVDGKATREAGRREERQCPVRRSAEGAVCD